MTSAPYDYASKTPVKNMTDFAARVISSNGNPTRAFDSCFEWWGAVPVAIALFRRTQKRPDTKLAANLFKYISEDLTRKNAADYADWTDLEALADHLKEEQARRFEEQLAAAKETA